MGQSKRKIEIERDCDIYQKIILKPTKHEVLTKIVKKR